MGLLVDTADAVARAALRVVLADASRLGGIERDGRVALVRRPPKGLLGGMLALPTSEWRDRPWADPGQVLGEIEHVFTHFALTLTVVRSGEAPEGVLWTPKDQAGDGLPSVFLKALRVGLA